MLGIDSSAIDRDSKLVPGLAKSWTVSDDRMTIQFLLRKAKWSDGKPIEAAQFVTSFKRALSPGLLLPPPSVIDQAGCRL